MVENQGCHSSSIIEPMVLLKRGTLVIGSDIELIDDCCDRLLI